VHEEPSGAARRRAQKAVDAKRLRSLLGEEQGGGGGDDDGMTPRTRGGLGEALKRPEALQV
jgi:hypothetical protein